MLSHILSYCFVLIAMKYYSLIYIAPARGPSSICAPSPSASCPSDPTVAAAVNPFTRSSSKSPAIRSESALPREEACRECRRKEAERTSRHLCWLWIVFMNI